MIRHGWTLVFAAALLTARPARATHGELECEAKGPYYTECEGSTGTTQLDGTESFDPKGRPLTYFWTTNCPGGRFDNPRLGQPVLTVDMPGGCATVICDVFLLVDNRNGKKDDCKASVVVGDSTPPDLTGCALEPTTVVAFGPALARLRGPRLAQVPTSTCPASGLFRVGCGTAADRCNDPSTMAPTIESTRGVRVGKACAPEVARVAVACDEVVELRLLPPGCPARPRPAVSVDSRGFKVISGQALRLAVTASDACGNASPPCELDPAAAATPLLCAPGR